MNIKIFADGADKSDMIKMNNKSFIEGLTTNPTLMKKAGIKDYEFFARDILKEIKNKPISFEVFSDDLHEMEIQAHKIAKWGNNVYVKIPVTNTKGEATYSLINSLSSKGVKVNVTAIMTLEQVKRIKKELTNLDMFLI